MLRSQSDVKFDTGDKEESGCLSANPALGLRWVLVPSETDAEEEQGSRGWQADSVHPVAEEGSGSEVEGLANGSGRLGFVLGQR